MSITRQQLCLAAARARSGPAHNRRAGDRKPSAGPASHASVETLLWDGSRLPLSDPGTLALRAFTQGNGYLPGQVIDRCA